MSNNSQYPIEAITKLKALAKEIRSLHENAAGIANQARQKCNEAIAEAILCGQKLIEAKELVGHGNWLAWIELNCKNISEKTAHNYMRLVKSATVTDLTNATGLRHAYILTGIIPDPDKPKIAAAAADPSPALPAPGVYPNAQEQQADPYEAAAQPEQPLESIVAPPSDEAAELELVQNGLAAFNAHQAAKQASISEATNEGNTNVVEGSNNTATPSFEHSPDCSSEDCALAGGPNDCDGVVVPSLTSYEVEIELNVIACVMVEASSEQEAKGKAALIQLQALPSAAFLELPTLSRTIESSLVVAQHSQR